MMERALKERIIGAAILVVVVVLVVPVFLDGPPEGGEIVSEQVPLPGQSDQETKTVVLDRDRSNPVPSNGSNKPAEVTPQPIVRREEPKPAPVESQPAPQPVVKETPKAEVEAPAPESSATGMWAVQLGSFGNQENAERLAADLRKQGHAAFLSQVSTANGQLHRVRVGPQADRASADAVAETLKRAGHDVKVLPHP
jgi:DedD protein